MMKNSDFKRIKQTMLNLDVKRYWGDDFDVRFYLISQIKKIKDSYVLDIGSGVGIISSQLDKSNTRINVDLAFNDLKICKDKIDSKIVNFCSSMTNLPFQDKLFDFVICSHILELAKLIDLEKTNHGDNYPTIEQTLYEISRVLKSGGRLYLTTPNNLYYKTIKLDYFELKEALKNYFTSYSLKFFNTYPRLSRKYRKINLANILPKLLSKIMNRENILRSLLKDDNGKNRESVSFYVEATKD